MVTIRNSLIALKREIGISCQLEMADLLNYANHLFDVCEEYEQNA